MKNAIIYLLNDHPKDKYNFKISIDFLIKNYLNSHKCDVVCFYEKGFDADEINFLKHNFNANLIFQEIEFSLPQYSQEILNEIPEYFPHPDFPQCQGFPMGYRHMCRFFAGEVFHHDILNQYDYVWRLDTDSFILKPIAYDVFSKMIENDSIYGYINIQNDHEGVIKNLWETCKSYFYSIGEFSQFFETDKDLHYRKVFYTNFEIFKMSWFKDKSYQKFYKFIDSTAGIYKYRWGDHVIRYIALNCLSDLNKCYFYNDIEYYHSELYLNRQYSETF